MRLIPRGRRRQTWTLFCLLSCIFGLIHIRSFEFMPTTSKRLSYDENLKITLTQPLDFKNLSTLNVLNFTEAQELFLRLNTTWNSSDSPKQETTTVVTGGFVLNFSVEQALQYGHFRPKKGFLTIGIPSVQREQSYYLVDTIKSLVTESSSQDRDDVTIVVMFCDDDKEWNDERALNLSETYEEHVKSGYLQIISILPQKYPDFNKLPRTYNDSVERLKWRSKQNIHYSFLFRYCHNMSDYYLHLEDDIKATKGYVQYIRKYNRISKNDWFLIRFTNMGFIGIFFRSKDLVTISDFFLLFYAIQPCDYLMNIIARIQLQFKEIRHRPSLFQHNGLISSLKNKRQTIIDKSFKGPKTIHRKKYYNMNPAAEIDTNMVVYQKYKAEYAYKISDSYFWAVSPQQGQLYTIVLKEPQTLKGIVVVGGFPTKKNDFINKGELHISTSEHCSDWTTVGKLVNGSIDTRTIRKASRLLKNVTCVEIEVKQSQNSWAIISEIALFKEDQ